MNNIKIDESWFIKPKIKNFPSVVSAGGVVVRKKGNKLLIALIRDPQFKEFYLPKGRVNKNEGIKKAAMREIAEETGLRDLVFIIKLGIRERLVYEKTEWRVIHYYLFQTEQETGRQDLDEGENFILKWFDIDDLPEMFWPEQSNLVEQNREKIKKLLIHSLKL